MLSVVLAIGSFVGALLMGAAVLSIGSGERRWRAHARADEHAHVGAIRGQAAFQPLQMQPFTLKWPSEVQHKDTAIPELPWPSETWDDEYFGTRSRDDVRRIAENADALDVKRARTTQQAQRRQAGLAEPEPLVEPPRPKKSKKQKKQAVRDAAERHAPGFAAAAAEAAIARDPEVFVDHAEKAAAEFFAEVGVPAGVPSPEEIVELVRNRGLQAAISQIRQNTGWDFQTATHHLAEIMRGRR